jgi:peptidoglycan/LPS O-acetylase OafA/YrhL
MSDLARPHHGGSFDCNRLLAAILVLYSHSYALARQPDAEPLLWLSGGRHYLGEVSVYLFFAMSGYLVTLSWRRDPDAWHFIQRRALRILPGLAAVILASVFLLGPAMTRLELGAYFSARETWTYLAKVTTLPNQHNLPGVFAANPYPDAVNGSLWSLRLEVTVCCMLAAMGALGLLRTRWPALAVAALGLVAAELITAHVVQTYILNASIFFIGSAMAQTRLPRAGLRAAGIAWGAVLAVAILVPNSMALFALAFALAAVLSSVGMKCRTKAIGDYSYGIYLWAFPVQQTLVAFDPAQSPLHLTATALPITFGLAVASWHLIEKRALAFKPLGKPLATPPEKIDGLPGVAPQRASSAASA